MFTQKFCDCGVTTINLHDSTSKVKKTECTDPDQDQPRVDSSVPLMHHDASDLRSLILIWIIPKERILMTEFTLETDVRLGRTWAKKSTSCMMIRLFIST